MYLGWKPPVDADGDEYRVVVREIVNTEDGRHPHGIKNRNNTRGLIYTEGVSSAEFTIIPGTYIDITAPNSGLFTHGEVITVHYTATDSNIAFFLRDASNTDTPISLNASNAFTVSSSIAEGDYRIFAQGDHSSDVSAPFRIEPKRIIITYPYDGLLFERGVAEPFIQWTANYVPKNGVTIMWKHGNDVGTIAPSAGPNEQFETLEPRFIWRVPEDFERRSGYVITLQDKALPSVNGTQDGTFSVVEPYEESFTLNAARSTSVSVPIDDYSEIEGLSVSEKSQSVSYVDGVGKLRQTISLHSSPDQQDMIGFAEYNALGKKTIDYLPYAGNSVDGLYVPTAKEEQEAFYCVDSSSGCAIARNTHPYSKTVVEASPLQTIKEQGAPGQQYQPGVGNTIRYQTHANVQGDALIHWTINGNNLVGNGFYPPSTLAISKTIDEDENTSYVYTDRAGREVLKVGYQNPSKPVQTYYVYDDYGNLRFIIPPEAVHAIEDLPNYQTTTLTTSSQIRSTWLTEMRYDGYHRVVEKKIPEAEPVYTVYDKFGRVALTQDGNMRANNEWFFTKYDLQGRAVLTGVYTEQNSSRHTRAGMQAHLMNSPGAPWEDRTAANFQMQHGYTNNSFPNPPNMEGMILWSVTYYDDYDFNNDGTPDKSYVDNPAFTGSADGSITNPEPDLVRTHGMVTGSKTRILSTPTVVEHSTDIEYHSHDYDDKEVYYIGNNGATTTLRPGFRTKPRQTVVIGNENSIPTDVFDSYSQGQWLEGVSFYDKYGRTIYSTSTNHVGGQDQSWTQYYFDGKVDRTKSVHSSSSATTTIQQRMEYDHAGRVLAEYHTVDGQPEKKITEHAYNELGQLLTKKLGNTSGSTFLQTLNYSYHLRGWLSSVNLPENMGSDLFAYRLYYDSTPDVAQSLRKHNGNIVAMDWRTKTPGIAERHRYDYSYDGLNQLTEAQKMRWIPSCSGPVAPCHEWTNYYDWYSQSYSHEGWSASYSYDLNGNIKTLNRAGTTHYNDDQLSYTYDGNQIQSITDNASSTFKANGFVDGATAAQEYYYDANGNMHKDRNKGIEHIRYNRMNLPEVIVFSSGHEIHYLYDAAGTKLSKTTYPAGGGETTTDYSGGFVYKNNTLEYFPFSEGRVRKEGSNWRYEYDLKDHLGNVRATFTGNSGVASLLQADSYYPFGGKMPGLSYIASGADENKFTYNGKELEDEFGLDWYHYGWRFYDPAVGRWWVTDPMDVEHSPYKYGFNSPIMFIDPDGAEPTPKEAALMAQFVYHGEGELSGGWIVSTLETNLKYTDDVSGFKSQLFQRSKDDGSIEYTYAFAGTEAGLKDWKTNAAEVFANSNQHKLAFDNAVDLTDILDSSELTYTGHSLGGGLSTVASLATGKNAITFNSAGLSLATTKSYGLDRTKAPSLITAYIVNGEILHYLQDGTSHEALGNQIILYKKVEGLIYKADAFIGDITINKIRNHGIEEVNNRLPVEE
jgi:RHS repeat-associated protein